MITVSSALGHTARAFACALSLLLTGGALASAATGDSNSAEQQTEPTQAAKTSSTDQHRPSRPKSAKKSTGSHVEKGKATYYSPKLAGKKMADGKPLDLSSNVAASKTLPLGSTAKVTNLKNGKSTTVKIEDRGPYAGDHTLDVTPKTASDLGMKKAGVAPISVEPVKTDDTSAQ